MYLHDALQEYITCGDTSIPAEKIRAVTLTLQKVSEHKSGYQKQFEVRPTWETSSLRLFKCPQHSCLKKSPLSRQTVTALMLSLRKTWRRIASPNNWRHYHVSYETSSSSLVSLRCVSTDNNTRIRFRTMTGIGGGAGGEGGGSNYINASYVDVC